LFEESSNITKPRQNTQICKFFKGLVEKQVMEDGTTLLPCWEEKNREGIQYIPCVRYTWV